jgi:catechol 2,3-dioxygenase-like lactoylglutathione lyase family enzyme
MDGPMSRADEDVPMRMHHAGISVPDLDASLAWYCAALGLRPGYRFEVPPLKLRGGFALGDGGTGVELLELTGSVPGVPKTDPPSANAVQGFNHVCFRVEDLEAAYARALEHGAHAVWDPRQSPEPGMRMAYVTDPDGNLIELVAPETSQPETSQPTSGQPETGQPAPETSQPANGAGQ